MESLNFTTHESMSSESTEDLLSVQNDSSSIVDIVWSALSTTAIFLIIIFMVTCIRVIIIGQKTRSPQQRRMYVGSRARPSLAQQEPSIFVSPSNLPPPPKYECMAPPSYDEVVGVHYPNYQVQPITTPITAALAAHTSTDNPETRTETTTETRSNDTSTVTRTADETIVNVPRVVTASS